MNRITTVDPRKFSAKVLWWALGLTGMISGGNAKGYDARPDSEIQNMFPHQNHFHIYLQLPERKGIRATNALMVTDAGNTSLLATASDALLLADAANKTITPEIVRKVNKALSNLCTEAESLRFVEGRKAFPGGLSPFAAIDTALYDYRIKITGVVKTVITQQPAHGKVAMIGLVTQSSPDLSFEEFEYTPDKDFLGDDKVVFEVTVNGQKFRVNFVVKVVHGSYGDNCEPNVKGGTLTPDVQIVIEDMQHLQDANAPEVATSWQSLFAQNEQIINSINLSFADLAGGAVGQTVGEDTNAANVTLTNGFPQCRRWSVV